MHYAKGERYIENDEEGGDWNTSICKGYKATLNVLGLQRAFISKWKNSAQKRTVPEVSALPKFLQDHSKDLYRKSQKTKGTAGLSSMDKGHCSWLHYQKDTGPKTASMEEWQGKSTAKPLKLIWILWKMFWIYHIKNIMAMYWCGDASRPGTLTNNWEKSVFSL